MFTSNKFVFHSCFWHSTYQLHSCICNIELHFCLWPHLQGSALIQTYYKHYYYLYSLSILSSLLVDTVQHELLLFACWLYLDFEWKFGFFCKTLEWITIPALYLVSSVTCPSWLTLLRERVLNGQLSIVWCANFNTVALQDFAMQSISYTNLIKTKYLFIFLKSHFCSLRKQELLAEVTSSWGVYSTPTIYPGCQLEFTPDNFPQRMPVKNFFSMS